MNQNRNTALERSVKITGGLNRFYGIPTSPSASIMAQNIQLFYRGFFQVSGSRTDDEVTLRVQPRSPQYKLKSVRMSSFSKWPSDITQTPEELAEAGFFYTGKVYLIVFDW